MTELIDETLMNYLEGKTSREDLIPVINKIKKSRLQKEPAGTNPILRTLKP